MTLSYFVNILGFLSNSVSVTESYPNNSKTLTAFALDCSPNSSIDTIFVVRQVLQFPL